MYKRKVFKWVAAACIVLAVGVLANVWWNKRRTDNKPRVAVSHDVAAPKETRAVITLANGSKVYLDSVNTGTIAQENNVNVIKNGEGGISYENAEGAGGMSPAGGGGNDRRELTGVDYNTLFNPRGSKVISLTLSDGTKVWLNSESSLRYPASFASSAVNREVEITGEAYFEVKHNAKQPFKVHLPNGSVVEDIGTSFNINAYPDEDGLKTTLIEGSVRVVGGDANKMLRPGQQAVINQANPKITRIEVQTDVDVDEVLAWKNGLFQFENGDIQTIMREVARWYDVNVVYEGLPAGHYRGKISRNVNLSQMLKILEEGGIKFKIEGRTITILK